MKKLITICLLLATTFTVKAQDGKPTKEQTVTFIIDYFKDKTFDPVTRVGDDFETWKHIYTVIEFDYNSSVMTIQYELEYSYNNYKLNLKNNQTHYTKYIFNLVDIEKINYKFSGRGTIDLEFVGVPNKTLKQFSCTGKIKKFPFDGEVVKKITLPVDLTYRLEPTVETTKLQKAFNHLRKLCGAPEPINFDGN